MAKVPNGVETFRKFQSPEYSAHTLQTIDRRQTDERAMTYSHIANVNVSSRSLIIQIC